MLMVMNLPMKVLWSKFAVDSSFFIPCLDVKPVANYLNKEAQRRKYKVICKQVVEKDMYGLRCWRLE